MSVVDAAYLIYLGAWVLGIAIAETITANETKESRPMNTPGGAS